MMAGAGAKEQRPHGSHSGNRAGEQEHVGVRIGQHRHLHTPVQPEELQGVQVRCLAAGTVQQVCPACGELRLLGCRQCRESSESERRTDPLHDRVDRAAAVSQILAQ